MRSFDFDRRVRQLARRGVVVFVRQSDPQGGERQGSQMAQLEICYSHLLQYGIKREDTTLIEAWGERATAQAIRTKFLRLRKMVRSGRAGIVVIPDVHRLSRNVIDGDLLFGDLERVGGLIITGSAVMDPGDRYQRHSLQNMLSYAELQNHETTAWRMAAKLALATDMRARRLLPTGLVWANPYDPAYRERLRQEKLVSWLQRLPEHDVYSDAKHVRYYILPFPDRLVVTAVQLCIDWLLADGIEAVIRRIREGTEGWPVRGKVPRTPRVTLWRPTMRAEWVELVPNHLYRWYKSPALYGIYSLYFGSLADIEYREQAMPRRKGRHFPRREAETHPALPDALTLLTDPTILDGGL